MSRIADAFAATPRVGFLRRADARHASENRPLPIGHGATNSQPSTVRDMLELLDVGEGHRVLDVGSGSGWTTALLAHLVGPTGLVVGVELEPALVEFGAANLARLDRGWAKIKQATRGVLGAPGTAPFDRILVSAMSDALPRPLVDQLAPDGVLVAPVAGRMLRVERAHDELRITSHGAYVFVPLR